MQPDAFPRSVTISIEDVDGLQRSTAVLEGGERAGEALRRHYTDVSIYEDIRINTSDRGPHLAMRITPVLRWL